MDPLASVPRTPLHPHAAQSCIAGHSGSAAARRGHPGNNHRCHQPSWPAAAAAVVAPRHVGHLASRASMQLPVDSSACGPFSLYLINRLPSHLLRHHPSPLQSQAAPPGMGCRPAQCSPAGRHCADSQVSWGRACPLMHLIAGATQPQVVAPSAGETP